MTTVLKAKNGKVAVYVKPASGDPLAPFNAPASNFDRVKFHSNFDYYQLASGPTPVMINHASVAGKSVLQPDIYHMGARFNVIGQMVFVHYNLVDHNLGYVPPFLVIQNNQVVAPTTLMQNLADGRQRSVTPYATTTQIRLFDCGVSTATALAAISLTYQVIVFRTPQSYNNFLVSWREDPRRLQLGGGKFDTNRKMLRRAAAGDSPYDLSLAPSIDIKNGGIRQVFPDGTVYSSPSYDGTFTGPATLQCVVK